MQRIPHKLSIKIILILALATTLFACNKTANANKKAAPAPNVTIETVKQSKVKPSISFVARTEATENVSIRPQVQGKLLKRHFAGGSDVKVGDLLFEIDPAPYLTVVKQKAAILTQAKSSSEVANIRWRRGNELSKTGAISDMDMDVLVSNKLTAEAQVSISQADLDAAELDLSYTKISAPINGRISRNYVSIGDLITANNTEMATLLQLDPIWVNFQVAEKSLMEARTKFGKTANTPIKIEALKVEIQLDENTRYEQLGKIDLVDNSVDANTGTLAIRAIFANPNKALLPGQYTNIILSSPNEESVILIAQSAVQEDQQGRFVLVINAENKVEKRIVKLGPRYDVRWEVDEGLKIGDKVITDGLQKVRTGMLVTTSEQEHIPFSTTKG